ncbi:MAG TPA: hypothetical protein VEB19_04460 [Gemmatimonadaceae bacterium]|nr:hypothetical protein [Gemmatimonadaceae bacterium]
MRGYAYLRQKHISPAATYDWSFAQYYYLGQWVDPISYNIKVLDSVFILRSQSSINLNSNGVYYCGPAYPQNPECFTHNGSTTLILTRATADLQFTADSVSVAIGSTVKFPNKVINPSVSGIGIPKTVLRYIWFPDDTSQGGDSSEVVDSSSTACTRQLPADSTCTRVIQGPGTLTIVARVNGKTVEKHIHVNAVTCPVGDSIADQAPFRKGMKILWEDSGADADTNTANNQEVLYGFYLDSINNQYFAQQLSANGTPCGVNLTADQVPKIIGSAKLIATMHSHPFRWGAIYPANCGSMAGSPYGHLVKGWTVNGRASGDDWNTSKLLGVPGYIIDYDGIYKYDGQSVNLLPITSGGSILTYVATNGPSHYSDWSRTLPGCTRP